MTNRKKEFAKFFAGLAADQTISHWTLGLSGILPLNFGFITMTPALNTAAMVAWPLVTIFLVYYAWLKNSRTL